MDMTSKTSNSTAAASAPQDHQQEALVVPSPTQKEEAARNNKPKVRAAQQAGGSGEPNPRPRQEEALRCPRCSSKNTKFCYYNNYNLDQPRHFCKNCRRYWTQGGTLRLVPIGGGCRRNKRASSPSSSSAASSTTATSVVMENTFKTRLMLTAASTMPILCSPTTGLIPNDKLSTFTPMGSISGLDVAMEEGFLPFAPLSLPGKPALELAPRGSDTGFLPFAPLSLPDEQAPELAPGGSDMGFLPFAPLSLPDEQAPELAPRGSDMGFLPFVPPSLPDDQVPDLARGGGDITPTFLDMLTGGYFDAGSSSRCYGSSLSMDGGSKAMDMSFLLPEMGALATDPMQTLGELHWSSAEIDSYFNDDGGYAAAPAAGVEQQQQVVGDDQQQDDEANNKANKGAEA